MARLNDKVATEIALGMNNSISLAEALVTTEPRETAGARTSKRFDYQKDWTLCKLIELHESGEDYLLLCEHHDDIIVLDSNVDPSSIHFFQVKTKKTGAWTLAPLIRRPKSQSGEELSSILGRLFDSSLRFGSWVSDLNLVSNARFNLKMSDGDTLSLIKFSIDDLSEKDREKISSRLEEELGGDVGLDTKCQFEVSALSLEESGVHAKGRLEEFLGRRFEGERHPTSALYKTLFDEIKRRTSYDEQPQDFSTLVERKGISQDQFNEYLKCAQPDSNPDELWRSIESQLQSEGMPFGKMRRLKREWRSYEIARFNPVNESLQKLTTLIDKLYFEVIEEYQDMLSLSELLATIEERAHRETSGFETQHLRAIILWKSYEEPAEIPKANSKPAKEE